MIIPAKDVSPLNICCVGKPVKSFQDNEMYAFCHIEDGADETISTQDTPRKRGRRDSFVDDRHYLPTGVPRGSDSAPVTTPIKEEAQPEKTN